MRTDLSVTHVVRCASLLRGVTARWALPSSSCAATLSLSAGGFAWLLQVNSIILVDSRVWHPSSNSPCRVRVVDTVGAGDNCTAGVIAALLAGAPLPAAVECGCAAGTTAVQAAGGVLSDADARQLCSRVEDIIAGATDISKC